MYRLSADQMGGTMSTVDVTTNSTVMLSFLHWVIPQYIVLAPTSNSNNDNYTMMSSLTLHRTHFYNSVCTAQYNTLQYTTINHTTVQLSTTQ